jgi:hypothetical protein
MPNALGTSAPHHAREGTMSKNPTPGRDGLRPPSYVNVPVAVAYAAVEDGLVLTMVRILGLCWNSDHRRTPPLTLAELCHLTGRPDATLRRHLCRLEEELGWLRIVRDGLHLTLYPNLPAEPAGAPRQPGEGSGDSKSHVTACDRWSPCTPSLGSVELWRALQAAGVEEPARSELAGDPALDPAWVRAWQLWMRHPHRQTLVNPVGVLVQRLRRRQRPPEPYLRLAALGAGEIAQLRASRWIGVADLCEDLRALRALYFQVLDPKAAGAV